MSGTSWIKFFPSDWLAGTRGLSAAETGIYITLVAMMYERGEPLGMDDARLARLCGSPKAAFTRALDTLMNEGKIVRLGEGYWNERVERELNDRDDRSEKSRSAVQKRWQKRDGTRSKSRPPHAEKSEQKQSPSDTDVSDPYYENDTIPDPRSQIEERESPSSSQRREKSACAREAAPAAADPPPQPSTRPEPVQAVSDETARAVALIEAARSGFADGGCPFAVPPASGDLATARGWLRQGADVPTVRLVARMVAERRASTGQGPPSVLAYLNRPMAEAMTAPPDVTPMRGHHEHHHRAHFGQSEVRDAIVRAVARREHGGAVG